MEETLPSLKMGSIDLLKNLVEISSLIATRLIKEESYFPQENHKKQLEIIIFKKAIEFR